MILCHPLRQISDQRKYLKAGEMGNRTEITFFVRRRDYPGMLNLSNVQQSIRRLINFCELFVMLITKLAPRESQLV